MQLTVHTSNTGSQPGDAYPSSQLVELSLRIERTDDDTRLEVT
jgi:hypothetical protein